MARKFGPWLDATALDEGGQGFIFRVRNDKTGETAVLKRLKNLKRLGRFRAELEACTRLDHPNIVKVLDSDLAHTRPYIVFQHCEGGSLADNRGVLEWSVVDKLLLFRGICSGVHAAHESHVIHRDLKPENIFLLADRRTPLVGDFGLCFFVEDGERLTLTEEAVGARLYMAPELADGRADSVSAKCDLYALGKILYWLIAGTGRVFDRERHNQDAWNLAKSHPSPAHSFIYEVLDRTVVEDPSKRFDSVFQLIQAIELIITKLRAGSRSTNLRYPISCIWCGDGTYDRVFDRSPRETGRGDGSFRAHPHDLPLIILVCNKCGNRQEFHPRPKSQTRSQIWSGRELPIGPPFEIE